SPLRPTHLTRFPYTTLFRSRDHLRRGGAVEITWHSQADWVRVGLWLMKLPICSWSSCIFCGAGRKLPSSHWRRSDRRCAPTLRRSEEHTSELQSRVDLVCRL